MINSPFFIKEVLGYSMPILPYNFNQYSLCDLARFPSQFSCYSLSQNSFQGNSFMTTLRPSQQQVFQPINQSFSSLNNFNLSDLFKHKGLFTAEPSPCLGRRQISPQLFSENTFNFISQNLDHSTEALKNEEKRQGPSKNHFKLQIEAILNFLLEKLGYVSQEELDQEKNKYSAEPVLLELFDKLIVKFVSANKCREEMCRFVMRRAFSFLRDNLREAEQLSARDASTVLCKRYFEIKGINSHDDKAILSFLLPYKKNSRNKTPNSQFISEIFSSEAFCKDYLEYIDNIDEILEVDNNIKKYKLVDFLMECANKGSLGEVKGFRRLPWTKSWITTTKNIAFELLSTHSKRKNKKISSKKLNC